MNKKIEFKNVCLLIILIMFCFTSVSYGFQSDLGMGKASEINGQVILDTAAGNEELTNGSYIYGSMLNAIKTGNNSSLKIILPPEFKYGSKYGGTIILDSNTEIKPNIYTTDSDAREWWEKQNQDQVKDKTIIYVIDVNDGKIRTKMTANCMKYIDIFQYLCGDYDALKNPRGGLKIEPRSGNVDFEIETEDNKLIVSVNKGEVKVYNKHINKKVCEGTTNEFSLLNIQ